MVDCNGHKKSESRSWSWWWKFVLGADICSRWGRIAAQTSKFTKVTHSWSTTFTRWMFHCICAWWWTFHPPYQQWWAQANHLWCTRDWQGKMFSHLGLEYNHPLLSNSQVGDRGNCCNLLDIESPRMCMHATCSNLVVILSIVGIGGLASIPPMES